MQAAGDSDQHLHAGERLWAGEFHPEGDRAVPGEGVLHDSVYAGAIFVDGLHESEDADDSLRIHWSCNIVYVNGLEDTRDLDSWGKFCTPIDNCPVEPGILEIGAS